MNDVLVVGASLGIIAAVLVHELARPGRERDARDELGHVGVDHPCATAPREGGAVVTVDHEAAPASGVA